MSKSSPDLAALIGSRICHDLISPIGAINNGLELLEMSGSHSAPELSLISESVENASARIRFFRLAYGAASRQEISRAEITNILSDMGRGARVSMTWEPETGAERSDVRLVFLAIQCLESALAWGGEVSVTRSDQGWSVVGNATRLNVDDRLWSLMADGTLPEDISASDVQFCLLPMHCRSAGKRLNTDISENSIRIAF